ncbi:MAG: hypothetical protein MZV63_32415 [Marinilabiliales bacterium]|nr:hypothetical protein [Marinilabiliales bacterium]
MKTDPEDTRLMVPVKPGEKANGPRWGRRGSTMTVTASINEDSEGFVDGNRNWAYNWNPPYAQNGVR